MNNLVKEWLNYYKSLDPKKMGMAESWEVESIMELLTKILEGIKPPNDKQKNK